MVLYPQFHQSAPKEVVYGYCKQHTTILMYVHEFYTGPRMLWTVLVNLYGKSLLLQYLVKSMTVVEISDLKFTQL
jgi:hypothetical protein